mgnify:CR=1 FL=1
MASECSPTFGRGRSARSSPAIETGGAIGLAMDCGALAFGDADAAIALLEKVDQGDELAETIARGVVAIGKKFGLEWAGDWKTFKEYPHFQYRGGLTMRKRC